MFAAGRAAIAAAVKARWDRVRGDTVVEPKKQNKMSAAGRAAISAAAKKRWAKARAKGRNRL